MAIGKKSKKSASDEHWTPDDIVKLAEDKFDLKFNFDVAATEENKKCDNFLTKEDNALEQDWILDYGDTVVWCNPPGSKVQAFVNKAFDEWRKHNITICMLIPTNTISNKEFEIIWNSSKIYPDYIQIHPLFGIRPRFLYKGEEPDYPSRNGYIFLIFNKVI